MAEWQPIETAPKDKPILAWCDHEAGMAYEERPDEEGSFANGDGDLAALTLQEPPVDNAKQSVPPPSPFSEVDLRLVEGTGATGNPLYRLNKPLDWYGEAFADNWMGQPVTGRIVLLTVPVNFKTDLASVPRGAGLSPTHYKPATIIHDYLCQKARNHLPVVWFGNPHVFTMKEADDCLYDALLDAGCPKLKAWAYWAYVRARHIAKGEG